MSPDNELNLQPVGVWEDTPTNEATWPELGYLFNLPNRLWASGWAGTTTYVFLKLFRQLWDILDFYME